MSEAGYIVLSKTKNGCIAVSKCHGSEVAWKANLERRGLKVLYSEFVQHPREVRIELIKILGRYKSKDNTSITECRNLVKAKFELGNALTKVLDDMVPSQEEELSETPEQEEESVEPPLKKRKPNPFLVCTLCGEDHEEETKFCGKCGLPL